MIHPVQFLHSYCTQQTPVFAKVVKQEGSFIHFTVPGYHDSVSLGRFGGVVVPLSLCPTFFDDGKTYKKIVEDISKPMMILAIVKSSAAASMVEGLTTDDCLLSSSGMNDVSVPVSWRWGSDD